MAHRGVRTEAAISVHTQHHVWRSPLGREEPLGQPERGLEIVTVVCSPRKATYVRRDRTQGQGQFR